MKTRTIQFLIRILALNLAANLCTPPAFPEEHRDVVPRGNWALVESLKKDVHISLRMTFGDRIEGAFLGIDADTVRIRSDRQERTFQRDGIAEIWQLRAPDRTINGICYGILGGIAAGIIAAGAGGYLRSTGDSAGSKMGAAFIMGGIGFGAAIGAATDAIIKGDRLLYRK